MESDFATSSVWTYNTAGLLVKIDDLTKEGNLSRTFGGTSPDLQGSQLTAFTEVRSAPGVVLPGILIGSAGNEGGKPTWTSLARNGHGHSGPGWSR